MNDSLTRKLLIVGLCLASVGAYSLVLDTPTPWPPARSGHIVDNVSVRHGASTEPKMVVDGPTPWPPAPVDGGRYVQKEIRAALTATLVADGPTPWPQVTGGTNA
jgi:hypothetical protein